MKYIHRLMWLFLVAVSSGSCNFLDVDPYIEEETSLEEVFVSKDKTQRFLNNVYSYLPYTPGKNNNLMTISNANPWVLTSDEAFSGSNATNLSYYLYDNNLITPSDPLINKWGELYKGIRTASVFIHNVDKCLELSSFERRQMMGEARFLRAYLYVELMKFYGPVILIPDAGFDVDTPIEDIRLPRNTWDECVDFVVAELDKSIDLLPSVRNLGELGKATQGAAHALKSRMLLFAASPLYNGNASYADFVSKDGGVHYINQTYEESKWARAALAAKVLVEDPQYELHTVPALASSRPLPVSPYTATDPNYTRDFPDGAAGIDHYLSYANMFNGTTMGSENRELIFGAAISDPFSWLFYLSPRQMYGASTFNMTQNLVDAYLMVDGASPENPSAEYGSVTLPANQSFSGYTLFSNVDKMYVNRETRFYATVGFNRSYYIAATNPVTTNPTRANFQVNFSRDPSPASPNQNSPDYLASNNQGTTEYCFTGYLCRKFTAPDDGCYAGGTSPRAYVKPKMWADFRLAEMYLNYVEALNELTRGHTIDGVAVSRDKNLIKKYFNMIRYRAGLPGITDQEASDAGLMRQLILRERQVEFAWEGIRYFDVRRWKIGDVAENGPIRGIDVSQTTASGNLYNIVNVRQVWFANKVWSRRKNFWPIAQTEIINNSQLVQNPGW